MKKSFIALTLTLLLLVTLFTVPAFAEKAPGCIHTACAEPECKLICGMNEHLHTDDCLAIDGEGNSVYIAEEVCGKICHVHSEVGGTCYSLTCTDTNATHTHDENCWTISCEKEPHEHAGTCNNYLPVYTCQQEEHEHTNDCYECGHVCGEDCGVVPEEPEQPANNGGTQYYPDYDENPAPVESETPVYVADEDASPKTGDPVSVAALVALMAAAAACVAFAARKVRG